MKITNNDKCKFTCKLYEGQFHSTVQLCKLYEGQFHSTVQLCKLYEGQFHSTVQLCKLYEGQFHSTVQLCKLYEGQFHSTVQLCKSWLALRILRKLRSNLRFLSITHLTIDKVVIPNKYWHKKCK